MTGELLPPVRNARTLNYAGGTWSYDIWGAMGRPRLTCER